MNNGIQFSIVDVMNIADKVFGIMSFMLLGVVGYAYSQGNVSLEGVICSALFPAFNLVISQVTIRIKKPAKIEIFRYLVSNLILCPLVLIYVQGDLSPFWYTYFIMAVAAGNSIYQITGETKFAIVNSSLCSLSYVFTSYFFLNTVNWYAVSLHVVTMMMLSYAFVKMLTLTHDSYKREVKKSIELEVALKELEQAQQITIQQSKMSAIGVMAGGVAHEINNPLGIISNKITLLKKAKAKNKLTDTFFEQSLEEISSTVERIARIINGLRTVSRETNDEEIEHFDLKNLLDDVLGICLEKFKNSGIKIDVSIQSDDVAVYANRIQISQIFLNLLNNSFDAIEELNEKWIKLDIVKHGNMVVVDVIDSGTGISKQITEKIFDPFYTTKAIGKGTGLGLSISKNMLEKNNGKLYLDQNKKNTCFVMEIPVGAVKDDKIFREVS